MSARILLFRGVAIAPSPDREPLPIERKVRRLVLLDPEYGSRLEAIIDNALRGLAPDDDGGRHAA